MPRTRRTIGVFLALALLLSLALNSPPGRFVTGGVVGWIASTVLAWCWHAPVDWALTDNYDLGLIVPAHGEWESGTLEIQTLIFVRNIPMFVAMVLATTPIYGRHLLPILLIGLFSLAALDGSVVAYMAWHTLAGVVPPNDLAFNLLALPSVFHTTGGIFAAPIFIAAFIMRLFPATSLQARPGRVGRNEPCTCGSGLKAKRCCRRSG
jgi:hypothetical protein